MNCTRFGLLVRVNDLPQCRSFYRDMLHLGDPVTDSAFTVEFALSEQMILRLEQNHSPSLEHASSAAAWILECEDPQKLFDELANAGYNVAMREESRDSGYYFRGEDPEGNCFYVTRA